MSENHPKREKLKNAARLGKYCLEKRIGTGASSEVWRAMDTVEGIRVALKIPFIQTDPSSKEHLLRKEIRLLTRLRHPNLMPVKNADIIDGFLVLATELSDGTLDDCGRPMSVRRIISIMDQVLCGLAYAHDNKIVHCDITPGNIFLLPDGKAALGDFGISLVVKGKMKTIDDYGTPGYVAPEQAFGKPVFQSDCFSAALILYEFITASLPKWPFKWPPRRIEKLKERTSTRFATFIKKALEIDPAKRFANAAEMRNALLEAVPKGILPEIPQNQTNWRHLRREAFNSKYKKVLSAEHLCTDCGQPISEPMRLCPWCGSENNKFDTRSSCDYICPRCRKGVLAQWKYCPWCYGPGFKNPDLEKTPGIKYQAKCHHCRGGLMRFMKYCPWCHRKVKKTWDIKPFPEICGKCCGPVDTEFWNFCPWCKSNLIG